MSALCSAMLSQQQLERAQRENCCPQIQLEDPDCKVAYPMGMPVSDDSLFFLHFGRDKPKGYTNRARTMRLLYAMVCEEGFCWQLSAKTAAYSKRIVRARVV